MTQTSLSSLIIISTITISFGCESNIKEPLREIKQQENVNTDVSVSSAKSDRIKVEIKIPSRVKLGEPIELQLNCENLTGRDIKSNMRWAVQCSLYHKQKVVSLTNIGVESFGSDGPISISGPPNITLLPANGKVFQFDLSKCFKIVAPGDYALSLRVIDAKTSEIHFKILPNN